MIELLVVMGILAIVAAIATTNYFIALTRAKQKRTTADIRSVALAWEARAVDAHTYRPAGFTFPSEPVSWQELRAALVPTYTKTLPQVDGWKRPLEFGFDPAAGGAGGYAIRSAGRDGIFQVDITNGETSDPDCDIVYSNGNFVQYPGTVQSR